MKIAPKFRANHGIYNPLSLVNQSALNLHILSSIHLFSSFVNKRSSALSSAVPIITVLRAHRIYTMGGCASRPKGADLKAEAVPEAPVSPKKDVTKLDSQDKGVEAQTAGDTSAAAVEDSAEAKKEEEEVAAAAASSAEAEKPKEEATQENKPEEEKVEDQENKSETAVEADDKEPEKKADA